MMGVDDYLKPGSTRVGKEYFQSRSEIFRNTVLPTPELQKFSDDVKALSDLLVMVQENPENNIPLALESTKSALEQHSGALEHIYNAATERAQLIGKTQVIPDLEAIVKSAMIAETLYSSRIATTGAASQYYASLWKNAAEADRQQFFNMHMAMLQEQQFLLKSTAQFMKDANVLTAYHMLTGNKPALLEKIKKSPTEVISAARTIISRPAPVNIEPTAVTTRGVSSSSSWNARAAEREAEIAQLKAEIAEIDARAGTRAEEIKTLTQRFEMNVKADLLVLQRSAARAKAMVEVATPDAQAALTMAAAYEENMLSKQTLPDPSEVKAVKDLLLLEYEAAPAVSKEDFENALAEVNAWYIMANTFQQYMMTGQHATNEAFRYAFHAAAQEQALSGAVAAANDMINMEDQMRQPIAT